MKQQRVKSCPTAFLLDALLTCDLDQTRTRSLDRHDQTVTLYTTSTSSKKNLNGIPKRMSLPCFSLKSIFLSCMKIAENAQKQDTRSRRHISLARASIFILHSAGLCLTSSLACASNFKHCLRVKKGFCSHSGPQQSLVRCHSRTTQTIRRTSTSRSSTTTRSPVWQPCLRTLAQGASCRTSLNYTRRFPSPEARLIAQPVVRAPERRPWPRTRRRRWRSYLVVGRPHPQARWVVEVHATVKSVREGADCATIGRGGRCCVLLRQRHCGKLVEQAAEVVAHFDEPQIALWHCHPTHIGENGWSWGSRLW